jgi:hypothetical protein
MTSIRHSNERRRSHVEEHGLTGRSTRRHQAADVRTAAILSVITSTVLITGCSAPAIDTDEHPMVTGDSGARDHRRHQLPGAQPTTPAGPNSPTGSPETVAKHWLLQYRSAAWTDPGPSAWIDRVRPYVTRSMNITNETLRGKPGGADWTTFVRLHCTSNVIDIAAIVPPESPGTATAANVQVSGTVRTSCAAGTTSAPTEITAMTLVVIATPHGWRVDQRLF